uniref:Uncharacterized protein n=1 Tax=Polytomella parva TaxID=51329 RepID=A0A7S0YEG3_9CHLO|mmetsp:Transcript_21814/g.38938  ORF Transcript_21814/g.38938 Transcript_21814/m.38938 type:complete len:122 (+) Transcript_21814:1252-1617(+)
MASMLQLNTTKEEGETKANNIQSLLKGELDIRSSSKALSNPRVYCMNELLNGNDPTAMAEDEFVSGTSYGGSQDQNAYDGNRPELVPITNYYTDPGFVDPEAEVDSAICKEDPMLMPPPKV